MKTFKQLFVKESIKDIQKRSVQRQEELRKNPPTEETHTFIGKTKKEGWKHIDAAKNKAFDYRGQKHVIWKRPNHKGWWIALIK